MSYQLLVCDRLSPGMQLTTARTPSVGGTDRAISMSATSAADCSAALRLKNPGSESYLVLLTTTVDLKMGS
jgi:hypothetical protein